MIPVPDSTQSLPDRVRALADEAVAGTDLYVVGVEVRGRTGSRVVEVYVDGDHGAGLDDIADLSRRLGFLLDTEDLIKGKYTLHVSSPGADRPLTPRQYHKHVGRDLSVAFADGTETETVSGTLVRVDQDAIHLRTPGSDEPFAIEFARIRRGLVELPW